MALTSLVHRGKSLAPGSVDARHQYISKAAAASAPLRGRPSAASIRQSRQPRKQQEFVAAWVVTSMENASDVGAAMASNCWFGETGPPNSGQHTFWGFCEATIADEKAYTEGARRPCALHGHDWNLRGVRTAHGTRSCGTSPETWQGDLVHGSGDCGNSRGPGQDGNHGSPQP